MDIIVSLCNITGLILGFSVICFFEMGFLFVRLFHVICMNKSAVSSKMNTHNFDEAELNCLNNPKSIFRFSM